MAGVISLIRAVGIPWYRKDDWPALMAIFEDGAAFDSFEQWLTRAEEVERKFQRAGHAVVRAYLDPGEFARWCLRNGVDADRESRADFATEAAEQKYGRNQS
jgi:hypothetical protein